MKFCSVFCGKHKERVGELFNLKVCKRLSLTAVWVQKRAVKVSSFRLCVNSYIFDPRYGKSTACLQLSHLCWKLAWRWTFKCFLNLQGPLHYISTDCIRTISRQTVGSFLRNYTNMSWDPNQSTLFHLIMPIQSLEKVQYDWRRFITYMLQSFERRFTIW